MDIMANPGVEKCKKHLLVKKTKLTMEFDYKAFRAHHDDAVIPLFVLQSNGSLQVCTVNGSGEPKPGDIVFGILRSMTEESPDQHCA